MNRQTLIRTLERHFTKEQTALGYLCGCGEEFRGSDSWARHVANAIYPEH